MRKTLGGGGARAGGHDEKIPSARKISCIVLPRFLFQFAHRSKLRRHHPVVGGKTAKPPRRLLFHSCPLCTVSSTEEPPEDGLFSAWKPVEWRPFLRSSRSNPRQEDDSGYGTEENASYFNIQPRDSAQDRVLFCCTSEPMPKLRNQCRGECKTWTLARTRTERTLPSLHSGVTGTNSRP